MKTHLRMLSVFLGLLSCTLVPANPSLASTSSGAWETASFVTGGGHITTSSPILIDLDGDGQQEIILGTRAEKCSSSGCSLDAPTLLVVMRPNGSIKWSVNPGGPILSSPAAADINNDGKLEVVVTIGGDVGDTKHQGAVVAYDNAGHELWRFLTQDSDGNGYTEGVFSSPLLCDVNGDGYKEIAFGAWDQRFYLLNHSGQPLWSNLPPGATGPGFLNGDTVWSSPACADLDGDGQKEIIIGTDISHGGFLPDGTQPDDGGYLYVLSAAGQILVRRYFAETIYSSPAIGDINGDGRSEIVVGTGRYWWNEQGRVAQPYVYAFDTSLIRSNLSYADPAKLPNLPGWPRPTAYPGFSSPALADLDGDGHLDVVIGSGNPFGNPVPNACSNSPSDPDCYGAIYAWSYTGANISGFPMWPKDYMGKNNYIDSSPVIADVDGDGKLEILFSMLWDVVVVGPTGVQEDNLHTTWTVAASPAVGDTDNDGHVEVWIGGGKYEDQSWGYVWRFERSASGSWSSPWPMFHLDPQHTGTISKPPKLATSSEGVTVIHPTQHPSGQELATFSIDLANTGDQTLVWSLTDNLSRVSASTAQGTLQGHQMANVQLAVNTANLGTGTYSLGTVTFSCSNVGTYTSCGSVQVAVTLKMMNLNRHVFLANIRDASK